MKNQPENSNYWSTEIQPTIARELPVHLFNLSMSESTQDKIVRLRDSLEASSIAWNIILYFNHTTYSDPPVWARVARLIDPRAHRSLGVLTSHYHTRFIKNPAFAISTRVGEFVGGARLIRTIQTEHIDNEEYGYTQADARANKRDILKEIDSMPKPLMLELAPGGTRGKDAILGRMEEGLVGLGKRICPVLYVPISILWSKGYGRSDFNSKLFRPNAPIAQIEMGTITVQEQRADIPDFNHLIGNLAETLPPELRGPWNGHK